jgi:hypothetical protein
MMDFHAINWLSALVAALTGFVIGSLWYDAPLFQKAWMQLTGITKEQGAKANVPLTFGGAYVLNVVGAVGLAAIFGPERVGALCGALYGAFAGLFFIATGLGVIYLFEMRPLKLWLINAGYQVVNFAAMGAVIGAWPR